MLFSDLKNSEDGKYLLKCFDFFSNTILRRVSVARYIDSDKYPTLYFTTCSNSGSYAPQEECLVKFKAGLLSSCISFLSMSANSSAHFVNFELSSSMHITFSISYFCTISISTGLEWDKASFEHNFRFFLLQIKRLLVLT